MTLDEVKEKFKKEYSRPWIEVVDEHHDELFFRTRGGTHFKASSEDLNAYLEFDSRRTSFENKPFETCLCSPTHYEQIITSANRFSPLFGVRRGERIQFGNPETDRLSVEISDASSDFKNYFRFHEYFVMRTIDRTRIRRPDRENPTLSDFLYTPLTVKVLGLNESSSEHSAKKALELIEGCMFTLSYLKGMALVLEEELPKRQAIGESFQFEEKDFGSQLPFPKAKII